MYEKFYRFSEKPFECAPNPKFLYLTPSHQKALASMIHGIKEQAGFTVITGEVGTGKTTLIHSLLNTIDKKIRTVFVFHTTITFKELLRNILLDLDFRIVKESEAELLRQLSQYLSHLTGDELLAIIIDEAQNLSQEVMEGLQIFCDLEPKLIQVVLVGQPELDDTLNSQALSRLNHEIRIRRKIKPLSQTESKEYIDHRLRLAESSISAAFTPEAISAICNYARGIPRVINILCDNALLTGYGLSRRKVDADIIYEVIKEMGGPISQKSIPSKIASSLKRFHWVPIRDHFYQRKVFFLILFLLCLGGGFIFLIHGSVEQKPTNMWSIESAKKRRIDIEIASKEPRSQTMKQEIFNGSPSPNQEEPILEVTTAQKGQTLSLLAQKYYHLVHPTLVDFILDFNPEITNADLIQVNQRIKIPKITKEWLLNRSPNHIWKIHVGTFQNPGFVRFYRNEPALKGKVIEMLPRKASPQHTWYRVMVGPFGHQDECLKVIDHLKEKGLLPVFGGIPKME